MKNAFRRSLRTFRK